MRTKWRTSVRLATALIICLGLTGTASADLLWNQPQSGGLGGFNDNTSYGCWVADDFQLGTASYITQAGWAGGARPPASPKGFYVRFYDNYVDSGLGHNRPADSPAYQQYIPIANVTVALLAEGYYNYEAFLPASFTAAANTHYWFSVQADTVGTEQPFWRWLRAGTTNLDPGEFNGYDYVHIPVNQVAPGYYDLSYNLSGSAVPIPGAVWLLGSGLLGLVGLRRKFKK